MNEIETGREEKFNEKARKIGTMPGNLMAGLLLLIVGGLLLLRQLDYPIPHWIFSWEMLIVAIGLFIGLKNRFRDWGWIIMVGIGLVFLFDDLEPQIYNFLWPGIIIFIGLVMIFRSGKKKSKPDAALFNSDPEAYHKEDILDQTAVFGATSKKVLSKNFKGGEVVIVFAGAEIDLSQADFENTVKIEMVAIFGGVKLIVPPNWEIRSETAAIFGGIEDKRNTRNITNPDKVLILDGTAIFGGIEINSY